MTRIGTRHLGIAAIGGLALIQAGFIAVSAQESTPGTPVTEQEAPPTEETCIVSDVVLGGTGTTITIQSGGTTIVITTGEGGGFGFALPAEGSSEYIPDEPADPPADSATPTAGEDTDATGESGGTGQTVEEMAEDEAAMNPEDCLVIDEMAEDGSATSHDDVTPESEGSVISPADAIAIAQGVADGEFVSVNLVDKDGVQVYEVTLGDTVVTIDAATGTVLTPAP